MKATRCIMALAFLLAACGASDPSNTAGGSAGDAATTGSNVSDIEAALTGEYQTISGDAVDLASYRNSDLVVWFWAPW